jgi:16S rRNA G966 N2-methylase RsmD
MFSYYGSKSSIAHLYPKPKFGLIVEPFAGSAKYSLEYFDREVILVDKYRVVIEIWKYLQQASPKDILGLPRLKEGQTLNDFNLSEIEKLFLGFNIKQGSPVPSNKTNRRNTVDRPNKQNFQLTKIANNLFKIRHWKFIHGTYECLANKEATWFIDPPYFKGGEYYFHGSKQIDFLALKKWAGSRVGQVIVCENSSASWMPFIKLIKRRGCINTTTEVFWTNEKVETQASLF